MASVSIKWDHTVHYVNDLEHAIKTFKENELIAFHGGSHTLWGTYNALSYFDLCYIEFLALEDRELAASINEPNLVVKDSLTTLPDHEAFSRVALRTDNIVKVATTLKAQGIKMSPIMDGKRLDMNRNLVEWRMFTIEGDFQGLLYPFVIQWKSTDEYRLETLKASGIIKQHPAGKTLIKSAVFYVSSPSVVASHWQALFGLTYIDSTNTSVTLGIGNHSFIFKQGKANQLKQLIFSTEGTALKGKNIKIGEAEYVFSSFVTERDLL